MRPTVASTETESWRSSPGGPLNYRPAGSGACVEIGGKPYVTKGAHRGPAPGRVDEDSGGGSSVVVCFDEFREFSRTFSHCERVRTSLEHNYQYTRSGIPAVLRAIVPPIGSIRQIFRRLRSQLRRRERRTYRARSRSDAECRGGPTISMRARSSGAALLALGPERKRLCETVKRAVSRYFFPRGDERGVLPCAMLGFIMLGNAGNYGIPGHLLSPIQYRANVPTTPLIGRPLKFAPKQHWPSCHSVVDDDPPVAAFQGDGLQED